MCRPAAAAALVLLTACLSGVLTSRRINDRPIIGVMAQETDPGDFYRQGSSYIPASYVKYLEAAGARVVPIRIKRPEEEYIKLFNSINGFFLPGGNVDIVKSESSRAARIFLNLALKAKNHSGDYFPIWGTCQGLEQLTVFTANKNVLTTTNTVAVALPLNFTNAAKTSRMFGNFPEKLMKSLAMENITANFHNWSLSIENYTKNAELSSFYKVLSTSTDGETEYISSMEAFDYPIFGVQWHPEKAPFEWKESRAIVHSSAAVETSFYTALSFVSEAKKSLHHFSDPEEEAQALIYQYAPVYTGGSSVFEQVYFFD